MVAGENSGGEFDGNLVMLELRIERGGTFTIARLAGELTALDVERLTENLSEVAYGEEARLAIELSGLRTIDSTGLSALITVVTRSRLTQGRVALVAPSPFVRGILSVTRLDGWFDLCENLEDAAKLLS